MSDDLLGALLAGGMIDSHFHSVEIENKGLDVSALLDWCFENGLCGAVDVSVTPEDFELRRRLTARFPQISFAAGIYPSEAGRFAASASEGNAMLDALERQLSYERVVAVGEIGLDCARDYAPVELQLELFEAQVAIAARRGLPVIVHNRGCDGLLVEALRSARLERGGVMHCFSSDYGTASRLLDMGFTLSFAGNVTYKSASKLQEVARRVPDQAFLVETDAPYLSPVPLRGRTNHPGYIGHTYGFLSLIRHQPLERLVESVFANFARVFRVSPE